MRLLAAVAAFVFIVIVVFSHQTAAHYRPIEFRNPTEIRSSISSLMANAGSKMPFKSVLPRLDYQECLKRSICEAHRDRMKYGVIGLAMQLIFPPFDRNVFGSRIRQPFALAAQYGASRRADCSSQYDGCVVSWLKVMQKTVDYIMVKRENRDNRDGTNNQRISHKGQMIAGHNQTS